MYSFDEVFLIGELTKLSSQERVAFAVAAATRQMQCYNRFCAKFESIQNVDPREIVAQIWCDIRRKGIDRAFWMARLDDVMNLLPSEEGGWTLYHSLAEDALSSLAYSIRCLLNADPQEAAWSARRAYEACDQAAIQLIGINPGSREAELIILSHAFVQRELARQREDLDLLRMNLIDEVQRRAYANELLADEEVRASTIERP